MTSVNDAVFDRLVEHQIKVLRLASAAGDKVLNRLLTADRETFRMFGAKANDDGGITRVDHTLSAMNKINEQAYKEILKFLERELTDLAHYEVEFSQRLTENKLPYKYRAAVPPKPYTSAIVHEEPLAGGLLSEWVEGLKTGRFTRMRAEVRISANAKENVLDTVKRIRGQKKLNYRDGVSLRNARSARMLVNTVYNHVANKARIDFFNANKAIISGYMWSAILDELTCAQCAGLDGEVFPPEEFDFVPPAHPNCRCVAVPLFGPIDEEDYYDFSPPRKIKYDEWLRNQKASMQDELLGTERAAMFRRGWHVKKFTDASGIRYNMSELRNLEAKEMPKSKTARPPRNETVLKNFGWKPDVPDLRDHQFSLAHPQEIQLPAKVSLRKGMPPIFDQGELGSCVANACVAAHMFTHKSDGMMSRLMLYWNARWLEGMTDEDSGVMIRDGVKALAKFGVCTEKTWPYKIRKFRVDPPADADKEGLEHRITKYQRLNSLQDFQKCLAQGFPFVFGFSVYPNIYESVTEKHGILSMPGEKPGQLLGGHAVLAIGYDTAFHSNPVFKRSGLSEDDVPSFMIECRNSWGARWGDAGNFWMPAPYLNTRDLADDFWTIRA